MLRATVCLMLALSLPVGSAVDSLSLPESFEADMIGDIIGSGEPGSGEPPASPPPALPPGTMTQTVVEASFIVAGDVSSFDADAFKVKLAQQQAGVATTDITLVVSAASVSVNATIVATPANAQSLVTTLTTTSSTDLSASLGVTVQSVSAVTIQVIVPAPPPGHLSGGLSEGALIAAIVAPIVGVLVFAALYVFCRERRVYGRNSGSQYLAEIEAGHELPMPNRGYYAPPGTSGRPTIGEADSAISLLSTGGKVADQI